jgi:hypothetical protein
VSLVLVREEDVPHRKPTVAGGEVHAGSSLMVDYVDVPHVLFYHYYLMMVVVMVMVMSYIELSIQDMACTLEEELYYGPVAVGTRQMERGDSFFILPGRKERERGGSFEVMGSNESGGGGEGELVGISASSDEDLP